MTSYQITRKDFNWLASQIGNRLVHDSLHETSIWALTGYKSQDYQLAESMWDGVESIYIATQAGYDRLHATTR